MMTTIYDVAWVFCKNGSLDLMGMQALFYPIRALADIQYVKQDFLKIDFSTNLFYLLWA